MLLLVFALLFGFTLSRELYPQPTFTRSIHPLDIYYKSFCLESGTPGAAQGTNSQAYQEVQPCWYGQLTAYWDGQKMNLGIGMIGGIGASITRLGTFAEIRNSYQLSSNVNDGTMYMSIHFDESSKKLVLAKDVTSSGVVFQDVKTPQSAPLMTTSTSTTSYQPVAGTIYIGRLTQEPVSNTWAGTTLFFKMLCIEDGAGANDPEAIQMRWDIFAVGDGVDIPNLVDDLGKTAMDKANGASGTAAAAIVLTIFALLGVVALPVLFFVFRRRLIALSAV